MMTHYQQLKAAKKKLRDHANGKITLTFEQNCATQREVQELQRICFS